MALTKKITGSGIVKFLNFLGLAGDETTLVPAVAVLSAGAETVVATIPLETSASNALAIGGRLIGGFYIPASFEGGYIKFNRSLDGAAWSPVKDKFKAALIYGAASGDFVGALAGDFVAVEYLQIVPCDAAGTPVPQAGAAAVIPVAVAA
mgnify:CR=1 FL=1|tara:strand:- start:2562 stop:3011 length:450 start_codon:yes stop_codon:yes gene_type:complete